MIDVVLLGTGSAVPTARRNHPAIWVKYKAEAMLFDCGEGTQKQIRKAKLNPCKLTKLFITHWHGDHILGIPGLLQTLMMNGYSKTLEVYGPRGTKKYLGKLMSMFVKQGKIDLKVKEITRGVVVETNDFKIVAEPMKHGAPCLAYAFIETEKLRIDKKKLKKLKLPQSPKIQKLKEGKDVVIDGKKISAKAITYLQKAKKIAIVLDTRENPGIVKIAKGANLFICESSFLNEKDLAKDYNHLTVGQAAGFAKKAKVEKLILMHLSQRYALRDKEFVKEAKKNFKDTILAEDLDRFEI